MRDDGKQVGASLACLRFLRRPLAWLVDRDDLRSVDVVRSLLPIRRSGPLSQRAGTGFESAMADLYETLGVAKDATKDAIKRAFRSKAKAAHPDTGGSAEKFHAIEVAHRVLTDDERRAKYERSGTVDDQPDHKENAALSIIAAFVERFLSDEQFKTKDMIGQFRTSIRQEIEQAKGSIKEADAYAARCLNAQSRLKGKTGAELIRKMIANKISQAEIAKRQLEDQIGIRERALEIVADASFEFDKVPETRNFGGVTTEDLLRAQQYGHARMV